MFNLEIVERNVLVIIYVVPIISLKTDIIIKIISTTQRESSIIR